MNIKIDNERELYTFKLRFKKPKQGTVLRIEFNNIHVLNKLKKNILNSKELSSFKKNKKISLFQLMRFKLFNPSIIDLLQPHFSDTEIVGFIYSLQVNSPYIKLKDLSSIKQKYVIIKLNSRKYNYHIYTSYGVTTYLFKILYDCILDITNRGGSVVEIAYPVTSTDVEFLRLFPYIEDRVNNIKVISPLAPFGYERIG